MKTNRLDQNAIRGIPSKFYGVMVLLFTTFLFFLDEDAYNLAWMKNWGNWIVFLIYASVLWLFSSLFYLILRKKLDLQYSKFLGLFLGLVFGLFVLIGIVFSSSAI